MSLLYKEEGQQQHSKKSNKKVLDSAEKGLLKVGEKKGNMAGKMQKTLRQGPNKGMTFIGKK